MRFVPPPALQLGPQLVGGRFAPGQRLPTEEELASSRQFLAAQSEQIYAAEANVPTPSQPEPCPNCLEPHKAAAYVDLCHALMNSTELLFVD